MQNGLAISGDYLSAASFLGIAGLIFLFGFDGFLYSVGFLVAFLTVMFLLAERMRNAGKYTIADVLAFRLRERPARTAAALGTLAVVAFYLIAQMVGAGVLIQALVGIDFSLAVVLTGAFMLCYVVFGGMVATTWVQIIKAVLLMAGIVVMSIFVLAQGRLQPDRAVQPRGGAEGRRGLDVLARPGHVPGLADRHGLARPRARARHGRPAAHPDAVLHRPERQGRALVGRLGDVHHRLLLPADDVHRLRRARVPRRRRARRRPAPAATSRRRTWPQFLGGGEGTFGGDLFLAVIAGVAFATILAVVAGLVLSASGAVGARHLVEHHPQGQGLRARGGRRRAHRRDLDRRDRDRRSPSSAATGLNVSFMVGLAFAVAASANFPALLLALTWRRFNTTGAVTGVLFGVVSAIFLVIVSPKVWPGAGHARPARRSAGRSRTRASSRSRSGSSAAGSGTVLSKERGDERTFHELYVRSETGLGAERALVETR